MERKLGWKKEAKEGYAVESPFDKYALLAQKIYQIIVWDMPIEARLLKTYELLSYLDEEEKTTFQINSEDEKKLAEAIDISRENKRLMAQLSGTENSHYWDGKYPLTTQVLKADEVEYKKSRHPEIKMDALVKRISDLVKTLTLWGFKIEPKNITYKIRKKWIVGEEKARFAKGYIYDSDVFYIDFSTPSNWLHKKMRRRHYTETMQQQLLIGRILKGMLTAFQGKKILIIPEERMIP